jgi:hypothetical protein
MNRSFYYMGVESFHGMKELQLFDNGALQLHPAASVFRDSILLKAILERPPRNTEQFGCLLSVPPRLEKGLLNRLSLDVIEDGSDMSLLINGHIEVKVVGINFAFA